MSSAVGGLKELNFTDLTAKPQWFEEIILGVCCRRAVALSLPASVLQGVSARMLAAAV